MIKISCSVDMFAFWEIILSILGSELKKDLICVQDPHANLCEVKMLRGDFDLFAFTHVVVRGLIVEGQGAGSVELGDNLSL